MVTITGSSVVNVDEDTGYGTTIKVRCPKGCAPSDGGRLFGSTMYSDDSRICEAAIHAGVLTNDGGLVIIQLEHGILSQNAAVRLGSTSKSIVSRSIDSSVSGNRLFSVHKYPESSMEVQVYATKKCLSHHLSVIKDVL